MHGIDELKVVMMLNYLSDPMLERISKITSFVKVKAGDYVFKQDEYAKNLWAVKEGRVGLSFEKSPTQHVLVTELTPGMTFGMSSMVDVEPKKYIGTTKAITDLELFKWAASDLNALFSEDFEMGYIVMKRLAKILITRLQIKNIQFSGGYDR
ncbi:MAG: cyclic nucleotide-binding domain-containing protein [Deltaproteobacteria bacterium]|nr:cyclic nucleotide-binding domain-containing protein [Deltaproteobacteria bacterium]